jgi:signal transduction histidine kinase
MLRVIKGGIRLRLLGYAAGVALPLAFVGLVGIQAMWDASRHQLDGSIRKQSEIAAVAFDQWLDAQREPLTTVAAYFAEQPAPGPDFLRVLHLIVETRSHWVGLHVLGANGERLMALPASAPSLPAELAGSLSLQMQEREWAIDTDWSRGDPHGILLLAVPIKGGGAVIAQVDIIPMSRFFLKEVKLADQSVFSVFGPRGRILLYRNPDPETYLGKDMTDSLFLAALNGEATAVVELKSPIDEIRRVYGVARAGETGCVVMVGLPSETLYASARTQLNRYLLFSVAGLLLAMGAAIILARGIAHPIRRLSDIARRFGSGALSTRAAFSAGGEVEELRASFNSMAEQIEEREERLKELDRLKSDFVSGVSHEMRTPLTTIKTLTDVLLRDKVSEAERRVFLETIAAECDRQIDLVLNLLDLSRIEAGIFSMALSPVDVREVINICIKIGRHNGQARHHEFRAELPDDLPPVLADRRALRRVLCGLVENAIKYTPDGGRITLGAVVEAGEVQINVTDTGRGILAEDLPHIFEKFYRGQSPSAQVGAGGPGAVGEIADAPGVGLGLYLARRIIEEIGGRISVESVAGRGSIFTLRLPAWDNRNHQGSDQENQ